MRRHVRQMRPGRRGPDCPSGCAAPSTWRPREMRIAIRAFGSCTAGAPLITGHPRPCPAALITTRCRRGPAASQRPPAERHARRAPRCGVSRTIAARVEAAPLHELPAPPHDLQRHSADLDRRLVDDELRAARGSSHFSEPVKTSGAAARPRRNRPRRSRRSREHEPGSENPEVRTAPVRTSPSPRHRGSCRDRAGATTLPAPAR